MGGRAYIGTSGWNYDAWRDSFYEGRPRRDWLAHCAKRFSAIEANATFYRLQTVETFRRWRDATPPGFRFAIKANRYLTHNKKLADPLPAIRLERERASGLGPKLAAVVWQLAHNFHCNAQRLEAFARALRNWASKLRRWMDEKRDVHVYFDNDAFGHAPADALQLIALVSTDADG
jgi:uncharacterized protein YecE (DUF72 family)